MSDCYSIDSQQGNCLLANGHPNGHAWSRPLQPPPVPSTLSLGALVWLEDHLEDDFKAAGCYMGEVNQQYADDFGPEHRQLVQELYLWLHATWESAKR